MGDKGDIGGKFLIPLKEALERYESIIIHRAIQEYGFQSEVVKIPKVNQATIDIVLPVIICPEAYDQTDDAGIILVDLPTGEVTNENDHTRFKVDPIISP
jgi:hypothetical protein